MPITTKVVSSNPIYGEVYSIQHYVIKFCQWLATGRWFSPGTAVSSTNKTDLHDITEILLKVVLNTITLTPTNFIMMSQNNSRNGLFQQAKEDVLNKMNWNWYEMKKGPGSLNELGSWIT